MFWMVYVKGGHSPTYSHGNEDSAREEAERLAKNTGCITYVLKAIARCEYKAVCWTEMSDPREDPPF